MFRSHVFHQLSSFSPQCSRVPWSLSSSTTKCRRRRRRKSSSKFWPNEPLFRKSNFSSKSFFRVSDYLIVRYDSDHRLYYFFIFFKFSNHTKINYKKAYYSSNFQRVKLLGPIFFLKYIKQKSKRVFSTIYYFLREFFLEHHRSGGGDLFEFEYLWRHFPVVMTS